jgi:hypothetical protein
MKHDVVLIANAPVEKDHRAWIDSCAYVVRFNVPRDTRATTGARCDALCVTNHGWPGRQFAKYRKIREVPWVTPTTEIWFPRPTRQRAWTSLINTPWRGLQQQLDYSRHIVARNGLTGHGLVYFSEAVWARAFSVLSLDPGQRDIAPSTGFLALTYCLDRFPGSRYRICLLGFTFQGSAAHAWDVEKAAVERMGERCAIL